MKNCLIIHRKCYYAFEKTDDDWKKFEKENNYTVKFDEDNNVMIASSDMGFQYIDMDNLLMIDLTPTNVSFILEDGTVSFRIHEIINFNLISDTKTHDAIVQDMIEKINHIKNNDMNDLLSNVKKDHFHYSNYKDFKKITNEKNLMTV